LVRGRVKGSILTLLCFYYRSKIKSRVAVRLLKLKPKLIVFTKHAINLIVERFDALQVDVCGTVLNFLHARCKVLEMTEESQIGELDLLRDGAVLVGEVTHVLVCFLVLK